MARAWLIDSRGLARKVKNAGLPAACQIKDCGANLQCPNCNHLIDNSDGSTEWPGLPAGVKFKPTDEELLEHLAAKCGVGDLESHKFIDEFIPTLEGDEGICYTHPENLPGAKKDGSSIHFFYRIANAYANGKRKRRRIQDQESMTESRVRWHKTGKTKPVMEYGVKKGYKKIMVLYGMSKKGSKPDKCNWVMHQYHLGIDEEEKQGEYVVSKIFYQTYKGLDTPETSLTIEESDVRADRAETSLVIEESDMGTAQVVPRTPKTNAPDPPRAEKTPMSDYGSDDYFVEQLVQEVEDLKESSHLSSVMNSDKEHANMGLAEDSIAANVYLSGLDSLLCNEINAYGMLGDIYSPSLTQVGGCNTDFRDRDVVNTSAYGISELENLELDTPPDFQLSDLQLGSQDSVFEYFDRL